VDVIDLTVEKPPAAQPLGSEEATMLGQTAVEVFALQNAASGGVALALGEFPPSQREPVTGHEAVDVRSVAADRYLRADRVGLPGDAHHGDEEPTYAQALLERDFIGHRIAMERIESAPSVSTKADEINARQLVEAHYVRMEADER
jgi:hypothetical protein